MEIKTIVESLRHCTISEGDCYSCPSYHHDSGCLDRLHAKAAAALESQQKRIAELEETVIHQRKRASDAEDFICMLCTECDWEREGDTIIMAKHCCEFGMPECGKFKLRGTDPGRWIPVTEQLPKIGGNYFVVVKYKYDFEEEYSYDTDFAEFTFSDGYIDNHWNTYNDWDEGQQYLHVTHWMPLPELPKEDA